VTLSPLSIVGGFRKSARPVLLASTLVAILLAGGCASRGPSQKEIARANWNEARARVLLNLASDQFKHGNLVDARKTTNDALKLSDRVAGVYVLKAKLDIESGELQSASAALEAAKTLTPEDPEPYYLSGIIAERWQKPEEALVAYQTASEKAPNELAYLLARSEMLMSLDRAPEAAETLEARLVFFESSAPIRDMLGQVYQSMGRHEEAADIYRQAALLASDEPSLRERQALALVEAGQWRRAADLLERLIASPDHSENVSLHIALGECWMQLGNPSAARATFTRATRLEAQSVPAWLGLGKAALESGDLERVTFALRQAEGLRPAGRQAADLALLRGYLYLKQDQVSDAAASFAAAGRIEPQDPTPLIMYGLCQQRLGKMELAREFYRRALELDPSDLLARELLGAVASMELD